MTGKLTERQKWILKYLVQNPMCSTNQLYINTSRACLATGRRRAMGTYGWKAPHKLKKMGLVECFIKVSGKGYRRQKRYSWRLTTTGVITASLIPTINESGVFNGKNYQVAIG